METPTADEETTTTNNTTHIITTTADKPAIVAESSTNGLLNGKAAEPAVAAVTVTVTETVAS